MQDAHLNLDFRQTTSNPTQYLEHAYTTMKQLLLAYLKFTFNWASWILSGNPTRTMGFCRWRYISYVWNPLWMPEVWWLIEISDIREPHPTPNQAFNFSISLGQNVQARSIPLTQKDLIHCPWARQLLVLSSALQSPAGATHIRTRIPAHPSWGGWCTWLSSSPPRGTDVDPLTRPR